MVIATVPNFGRTFTSDSLHWWRCKRTMRGHRMVGGSTLAKSAYPPKVDQGHLNRLRDRIDEFRFDEHGDAVSSLLEENARLALMLSTMILKFLDQK